MLGLPDVVWAGVIASLLTLGGVLLTNRGSNNRNLAQLNHDKDQRNREREMVLRREVYLRATETISEAMSAIVRIADLNVSNEDLGKDISNSTSSINKIHVVGKDSTVYSTAIFSSEMGYIFLKLITDRIPLLVLKEQISTLEGSIEKSTKEREGIIEMMKDFNIKGNADRRLWDVLNENFNFQGKQLDNYFKERLSVQKVIIKGQINLIREIAIHHARLRKLLIPTLIAIREELELPLDKDKYSTFVEEDIIKNSKLLNEWIERIEKIPNA